MAADVGRLDLPGTGRAKWVVVAACFLVLFVVNGSVSTYGVFITPIEADFGWSRTTISLTFTIYLLATAVAAPVTGNLIDSYGPNRTLPVFIALVAVPMLGLSALSSLGHLYLLYAVIGGAITGLALSHFSSIITKWFETRTLVATGIALSGYSLGRLVFNPLAAELIVAFDWRTAYLVFGLLALVGIPIAYFLVTHPDAPPEGRDGPATPETTDGVSAATPSPTVPAALRSPSLWLLVVTFYICGFTTVGLMSTHFVPYLVSIGFAEPTAAQGAGVMGGMTVFGLLGAGAIGDRFADRQRHLLSGIYLLRGVTLLSLLAVATVLDVFLFAAVYGFLTLCTIPLHASITADRFGSEHLTTLVGVQFTGHQLGGATAAIAAGWVFDTMGSYRPAHLLGVGLLLVTPVLVMGDRFIASRIQAPIHR